MMDLGGKPRCEEIGEYIAASGKTVRDAARCFGISKSTVHKDVTKNLYAVNRTLYDAVQQILQKNKSERHLRGGEATRQKYLKKGKNERH